MFKKPALLTIAFSIFAVLTAGCSKRHIIPAIITGSGGVLITTGAVYRSTVDTQGSADLFGETTEQRATTSTLLFTGTALILVGIIWSATQDACESNADCWSGDVCSLKRRMCIPKSHSLPQAPLSNSPDSAHSKPDTETQLPKVDPL